MRRAGRLLVLNERDLRHPKAGGAETHVFEIMSRLVRRGYEVSLLASSFRGAAPQEVVEGVAVWRYGPLVRYYPAAAVACGRATRRGEVDVVLECLNKVPFFSPLYSAAPVLVVCHHLFGETAFHQVAWPIATAVWCAERLVPPLYRRQRFLAISGSSRDDLVRRGIAADRIVVSHCGIRRPHIADPAPLGARPCRVSYVGRLEPYKRIDVLLRAAARLTTRFPALEITLVGRGSDRARLEALGAQLGIAGRVHFAGFVSDDERDAILARSRACVCPSEKEGWGLTVIEANALGTPVVASDAPGLRDSVRAGETGYLVPTGDVVGFAARMGALLSADVEAERMGCAALEWSRRFDWDTAADEMERAIEAVRRGG